jgi:hypothetical protein
MVINKNLSAASQVTVNLANFAGNGDVQVWQLTAANTITQLDDLASDGQSFTTTVPAQSITLFVVPNGSSSASRHTVAAAAALCGDVHSSTAGLGLMSGSADMESLTPVQRVRTADEPAPTTGYKTAGVSYRSFAGQNPQNPGDEDIANLASDNWSIVL